MEVKVPDIGDYKDVEIIEVLVKAGDSVKEDSSLITLETDKATIEIPSPDSGLVKKLLVKVGDKVSMGSSVLVLEKSDATDSVEDTSDVDNNVGEKDRKDSEEKSNIDVNKEEAEAIEEAETVIVKPSEESDSFVSDIISNEKVSAGPATRRLADEFNVDLALVVGTGRKGRITTADLTRFIKNDLGGNSGGGLNIAKMPEVDFRKYGEIETVSLNRIKKKTSENLSRNWVTIPHVTHFDEADITEMENFRKENKSLVEAQGAKLTPLVFIMKAVVATLKEFPEFNASLSTDGKELIYKKYYHFGIAVDTEEGLVVPVIRDVETKTMTELALELAEISKKAREGKLSGKDMQGSCFSISSLGGIGGHAFTPIINAPDVAILGVSRSSIKPVYINNEFVPRLILPLSLSYDHRVIDGAAAARFCSYLATKMADIRRLLL